MASAVPPVPQFPAPKTDKPRPHVCTTCMRSFARLEHLKRHERSHTKEKPFACSECTRCFARRDLLLRHQQKLHSTTTPSAKPRQGRRESVAGGGPGKVRKNSMASSNSNAMRPRANTLSHVDAATIGMLANSAPSFGRSYNPGHNHHNSMSGMPDPHSYSYRGMTAHHVAGLPKIETGLPMDLSGGLRTAPPYSTHGTEFPMGFVQDQGSTINPHALHMGDMNNMDQSMSFQQMFYSNNIPQGMHEDESAFDWMARGFENQMTFTQPNENAIDDSSPSAMSTNSPANMQDHLVDMHNGSSQMPNVTNPQLWQQMMPNTAGMISSPVSMDFTNNLNEMLSGANGTISPKSLLGQGISGFETSLPTPPDMAHMDPSGVPHGIVYNSFHLPASSREAGTSGSSNASMDSSLRMSSVTTMSGELVNDGVRNTLIAGLSQSNPFSQRKYSQPMISSPLSPESPPKVKGFNAASFPTTLDLQRYVAAYIKFFHPHLPFLHLPSLNFESNDYATPPRFLGNQPQFGQQNATGGGSCLILSIAAIGAVYEREMDASRELFQWAHRFIFSYLEMRRKADMHRTQYAPRHASESEETPLWLVQAMLLHVIYGHNCGDKTAAEVASNHCSSLVSLARDAHLARPHANYSGLRKGSSGQNMNGGGDMTSWTSMLNESEEIDWMEWKTAEERKRTLYAVFILSSMLVMAYNHAPALTNSEIRLELPCDEELWAVDNPQAWLAMGGANHANHRPTTFANALSHLLTSSQRRRNSTAGQPVAGVDAELKPSTFGCLILVNALHNYIWETRQRHLGRQWTARDTEQMHAHIEPALRAWEAAWASNPSHSLERPNPFGAGPLSADSVPLLDLAYVRLYINLGRSKEAFWQRDYKSMAEELARSPEVAGSNAVKSPLERQKSNAQTKLESPPVNGFEMGEQDMTQSQPTQRERQLRRAAFYASDSLLMADKLGLIFEETNYKELTAQSALCAFDCAQVLSEWLSTVQERVGKYIGVLGQDEVDLMQVPAILLLEDEDRQLLGKIDQFIRRSEQKLAIVMPTVQNGGYSPAILNLTAQLLERAAVWPGMPDTFHLVTYTDNDAVTKLMGQSLDTQASHMRDRATLSVT